MSSSGCQQRIRPRPFVSGSSRKSGLEAVETTLLPACSRPSESACLLLLVYLQRDCNCLSSPSPLHQHTIAASLLARRMMMMHGYHASPTSAPPLQLVSPAKSACTQDPGRACAKTSHARLRQRRGRSWHKPSRSSSVSVALLAKAPFHISQACVRSHWRGAVEHPCEATRRQRIPGDGAKWSGQCC